MPDPIILAQSSAGILYFYVLQLFCPKDGSTTFPCIPPSHPLSPILVVPNRDLNYTKSTKIAESVT